MVSTLIETININAEDFTDNFLTCPTCMGSYDEHEHTPKLLPCSHTLCKCCLERIAATAVPLTNPVGAGSATQSSGLQSNASHNSLSRSVAAADAAAAATNSMIRQANSQSLLIEQCFRCPICRETIVVPRCGGVAALPPSFIVNQLLDLVKHQRRDLVPRCTNHPHEELLFCETCDQAFCSICESHCRVVSNADHIVIPFSIAIKRMTEIFLFKSNQCINSFNLALGNVQREIESLNRTVEQVAESVEASLNDLKALIDVRRDQLLKDLFQIKASKTKVLTEQMKLIANEKQTVEFECQQYHQSKMESKLLGAQIQNLNEKLDCLRSLFEPRENSFINYEHTFNDVVERIETSVQQFGRFKVSNTYPPLCTARLLDNFADMNLFAGLQTASVHLESNNSFHQLNSMNLSAASTINCSANLAVYLQIDTVDYYGQKRTEGGDPVSVLITDPAGRQQSLTTPEQIIDFKNGTYICKYVPQLVGRHRVDVNIFMRPINKMPILLNATEFIDSLWMFGGAGNSNAGSGFSKGIVTNKGSSDRDFNMPISVRCLNGIICVLDSGNNRIKLLNKQGQFMRHIQHSGLTETSCTALISLHTSRLKYKLFTINWRSKLLSDYDLNFLEPNRIGDFLIDQNDCLTEYELPAPLQEPVGLMETSEPHLFIIQDKKKLHLCTSTGRLVYESLEAKMRTECNVKNITAFCGHAAKFRLFVADLSNTAATIYEFDLDWLCENRLDALLADLNIQRTCTNSKYTFRKYASTQSALSTSSSSLNSNFSVSSSATTSTTLTVNSLGMSAPATSSKGGALHCYTALWFDPHTNKLLAAKCDKQKKTVIEIYNSDTYVYEYSIENSRNEEKPLKRVTSMCCTDDGKVVCVDLIQNCVKLFRFV